MNIYDLNVKDAQGKDVSLAEYKGKVLLIVNTATGCGFTPQYEGLEVLYKKYKDKGFEILDFPSNQFLGQAPGTNEEIVSFCQLNYGVSFQTFSKIDVNGENADPLFVNLREAAPEDIGNSKSNALSKLTKAFTGNKIKWNFTKFLIDREGNVAARFAPTVKPADIESHIIKLLG